MIIKAMRYLKILIETAYKRPKATVSGIKMLVPYLQGIGFANGHCAHPPSSANISTGETNPLLSYFSSYTDGPGIWKFLHYFEIYHAHFSRFVGKEVRLMEVGVCGGGSLGMWHQYFGPLSHIYGVDIEPACSVHRDHKIDILVGDQGDPAFWRQVRATTPKIDIFIDDGSHYAEHQITTFEEILPHLNPGGVYLCEDILGMANPFTAYLYGLVAALNSGQETEFVKSIDSIHFYPFVGIVQKRSTPREPLQPARRGNQWPQYMQQYWPEEFAPDGSFVGDLRRS